MGLLKEATSAASPFATAKTQYFVLGDGRGRRALRALTRAAVAPVVPMVTIDPEYRATRGKGARTPGGLKTKYKSTKRVTYKGQKAESYRFDKTALGAVDNIVVVAVSAHTPAHAFVARAKKAAGKRIKVYALCSRCCFPGLRAASETIKGRRTWQLLWPRTQPRAARRPKLTAELRWRQKREAQWKAARKKLRARAGRQRAAPKRKPRAHQTRGTAITKKKSRATARPKKRTPRRVRRT